MFIHTYVKLHRSLEIYLSLHQLVIICYLGIICRRSMVAMVAINTLQKSWISSWAKLCEHASFLKNSYLAKIYLFKVSYRNSGKKCQICSKLTIKTQKRRQLRRSAVFVINFEHIPHVFQVLLLLTLNT